MALQFHPEYANLLAVGCYDGSVAVYDVRQKTNKPLYSASAKAKKHSDTVWQVCWQVGMHSLVFDVYACRSASPRDYVAIVAGHHGMGLFVGGRVQ